MDIQKRIDDLSKEAEQVAQTGNAHQAEVQKCQLRLVEIQGAIKELKAMLPVEEPCALAP